MSQDESSRAEPIVVEETFAADRSDVWKAVTELDQLRQWFFDCIPEFRAEPGFETRFTIDTGEREFPHVWRIVEAVEAEDQHRLVIDWSYENYDGKGLVIFELFDNESSGTDFRVINERLDTFPENVPEFTWESAFNGWTFLICECLKRHVDGEIA